MSALSLLPIPCREIDRENGSSKSWVVPFRKPAKGSNPISKPPILQLRCIVLSTDTKSDVFDSRTCSFRNNALNFQEPTTHIVRVLFQGGTTKNRKPACLRESCGVAALTSHKTNSTQATTIPRTMKETQDRHLRDVSAKDLKQPAESVEKDFNSVGAVCGSFFDEQEQPHVEIMGMELLVRDEEEISSDLDEDSDTDMRRNRLFWKRTVDSLELTRQRLRTNGGNRRRSKPRKHFETCYPCGEVDSLVLAKERLPELVHKKYGRNERLSRFYQEGRGLMGEIDSLILDRRRLPHLLHLRESNPAAEVIGDEIESYEVDLKDDYESSTETTEDESLSPNPDAESAFTSDTGDSLILARRRLGNRRRGRAHWTDPPTFKLRSCSSKDNPPQRNPLKGFRHVIRRTSSGAMAA